MQSCRVTRSLFPLLAVFLSAPVAAQWYVGLGSGSAELETNTTPETVVLDSDDAMRPNDVLPWKVVVGRSLEPFAFEVFHVNFGELELGPDGQLERRVSGVAGRKQLFGSECAYGVGLSLSASLGVGHVSSAYRGVDGDDTASSTLVGGWLGHDSIVRVCPGGVTRRSARQRAVQPGFEFSHRKRRCRHRRRCETARGLSGFDSGGSGPQRCRGMGRVGLRPVSRARPACRLGVGATRRCAGALETVGLCRQPTGCKQRRDCAQSACAISHSGTALSALFDGGLGPTLWARFRVSAPRCLAGPRCG